MQKKNPAPMRRVLRKARGLLLIGGEERDWRFWERRFDRSGSCDSGRRFDRLRDWRFFGEGDAIGSNCRRLDSTGGPDGRMA